MFNKISFFLGRLAVIILTLTILVPAGSVWAWEGPPEGVTPPDCTGREGCNPPINSGNSNQIKSGGFGASGVAVFGNLFLGATGGEGGQAIFEDDSRVDSKKWVQDVYNGLMRFYKGGNAVLSLVGVSGNNKSDAKVGINLPLSGGTPASRLPQKTLDVRGEIVASGDICTTVTPGSIANPICLSTGGGSGTSLPAGSNSQTLRYNGTSWMSSSSILNAGTLVSIATDLRVNGKTAFQDKVTSTGDICTTVTGSEKCLSTGGGTGGTTVVANPGNGTTALTSVKIGPTSYTVGGSSGATIDPGTSGQTLRYDGTKWAANSNIYNNGTNVGIGTVSPGGKLTVVDSVAGPAKLQLMNTNASGWSNLSAINSSAGGYVSLVKRGASASWQPGSAMIYNNGNNPIHFITNGQGSAADSVIDMTITGAGDVGIGTVTPGAKLEVNGNVRATGDIGSSGILGGTGLRIINSSYQGSNVTNGLEVGYQYPNKDLDSGKIAYGKFNYGTVGLDITGAGTTADKNAQNRLIRLWDDVKVGDTLTTVNLVATNATTTNLYAQHYYTCTASGSCSPTTIGGGTIYKADNSSLLLTGDTFSIKDLGVSTAKLANSAVTASKLNQMGATPGQVLKWTAMGWAPGTDNTGTGGTTNTYTADNSTLSLSNTNVFSVNTANVQKRITGDCAVGSSIRKINENGTVVCDVSIGGTSNYVSSGLYGYGTEYWISERNSTTGEVRFRVDMYKRAVVMSPVETETRTTVKCPTDYELVLTGETELLNSSGYTPSGSPMEALKFFARNYACYKK